MNEHSLDGTLKAGFGQAESAAGKVLNEPKLEIQGATRQIEGKAEDVFGTAQAAFGQVADQAKVAVAKVSDQAKDVYERATDRVQSVRETVDPFVQEKPYSALGIAAAVGLLVGLLFAGRGPKVVYIRPHS